MVIRRKKPPLTFETDYFIRDNKCFGIFETLDGRVITKFFFVTKKDTVSEIRETEHFLVIEK